MAQLRRDVDAIHGCGAELVVIGNGTMHFAVSFRDELQLDTPLFVDPACASNRALGLKRGLGSTLGHWGMWAHMARALYDNLGQRRLRLVMRWWLRSIPALRRGGHGDAWQLGGVMVVLPDGRMPIRYVSIFAGDHPPTAAVLDALASTGPSLITGAPN